MALCFRSARDDRGLRSLARSALERAICALSWLYVVYDLDAYNRMKPLPITTQTAYAELLEQLLALDAHRSIGHAPGAFVTKTIKERIYYYFQYSTPGGMARQAYVGPKSPALDTVVQRFDHERNALRADRERIDELAAILRAGGASVTDAASARILGAVADAGVFKLGAVVVGTHAFVAMGNLLGVRWEGMTARTEDVDIGINRVLEVAVPVVDADVPRVIDRLEMGFLPVPGFSPTDPSTSFKVRGRGLRVDLVTPATGSAKAARPVRVERLNAAAAPVRYLEIVMDDAQPAAIINGGAVLVTVPHPARFAILKLLVAQDRPSAFQTKAEKDVAQAAQLIEALEDARPGELRLAWRDTRKRGKAWATALDRSVALVGKRAPALGKHLAKLPRS